MHSSYSFVKNTPGAAALPVIGIDIGGTWTRLCLVLGEEVRGWRRIATPTLGGSGDYIAEIAAHVRAIEFDAAVSAIAIGVGVTGPVDTETGTVHDPPNAHGLLTGLPLKPLLESALGIPATIEKDTNAAALAESRVGSMQGYRSFLFVTVSTGIGGAIIDDDCFVLGRNGAAGEFGHVSVQADGPLCGCGRMGCVEAIASGPAMARAAVAGWGSRNPGARSQVSGADVAAAARSGDRIAAGVLQAANRAVGSLAVDLANVFNPEAIVFGGSVIAGNPTWVTDAARRVAAEALDPSRRAVIVAESTVGERAVAIGAALLAIQRA